MIALIQLVTNANVKINNEIIAEIERGILAMIGIEKSDTQLQAEKTIEKILNYRIFPDPDGKMNLSLKDIQGALLLIPQFTLVAETNKGSRPGFSIGKPPAEGKKLFDFLVNYASKKYRHISCGQFGAYMQVSLCNDGPVTFILQVN